MVVDISLWVKSRISAGAIFALFSRFAVVGLSFLSLISIAAILGPAQYGQFALIWSLSLLLSAIVTFGGALYFLKEMSLAQLRGAIDGWHLLKIGLLWPSILTLIMLLFSSLMPPFLVEALFGRETSFDPYHVRLALLLGLLLGLNSNVASLLHGYGLLNLSMILKDALAPLVLFAVAGYSYLNGQSSAEDILEWTIIILSLSIIAQVFLVIICNCNDALIKWGGRSGSYRIHFWTGSLLAAAWNTIDIIVGARFMNAEELGFYHIIRRFCNLINLPLPVATWLSVSGFSRAFQNGDREAASAITRLSVSIALVPGLGLALLLSASIPSIHNWYDSPITFSSFFAWGALIASAVINLAFTPSFTAANVSGLEGQASLARVTGLVAYLVMMVMLGASLSPIIANGAAVLMGTALINLSAWWAVKKRFGVDTSVFALFGLLRK